MKSVTIIGGGINGLFSAYYLQQSGCDVSVVEQGSFADGCSFGNAGMIVPSHIIPLAQPGMIAKGLRWMLSSSSPFYVKPRLSYALAKWGYLFWKHSTAAHVRYSIPVLRDISLLSKKLFQELNQEAKIPFGWKEQGLAMLFKNANAEAEMKEETHTANEAGIEAHFLSASEMQALEPDIQMDVRGAVYYPGDAQINPNLLIKNLVQYLKNKGVKFYENETVIDFEKNTTKITAIQTQNHRIVADEVVITAGAWSLMVADKLGISLPLQGGKGYSFMIDNPTTKVKVPAIMLEARATATQMSEQLRFAGTMEIVGTDLSVNPNRVRGIVQAINNYYPDIEVNMPEIQSVWSGLRPCSPDGLPYIGRIKHFENLTLATGHGMMGISLGPATGKLVSEVISNQQTSMNIQAFEPLRFG